MIYLNENYSKLSGIGCESKFEYSFGKIHQFTMPHNCCIKFHANYAIGNLIRKLIIHSDCEVDLNSSLNISMINNFGEYEKCASFPINTSIYKNMYTVDFGNNMLNTTTKKYLFDFNILYSQKEIFPTNYSEIIIYALSIFVLDRNLFESVKRSSGITFNYDTNIDSTKCFEWNIDEMNHDEFVDKMEYNKNIIVNKLIWNNKYAKLQYTINGYDKLRIDSELEFLALELLLGEKNVFYVKINPHNIDTIKFKFSLVN